MSHSSFLPAWADRFEQLRFKGRYGPPDVVMLAVLESALTLFFALVTMTIVTAGWSDYQNHVQWAKDWFLTGHLETTHFLYHLLVILVYMLIGGLGFGFTTAGVLVVLIFYALTVLVIYMAIRPIISNTGYRGALVCAMITLGLMIMAPIPAFYGIDRHLYYGYIAVNVYHNPTTVILKPLALILFLLVIRALANPSGPTLARGLLLALCVSLTALAKPSYTIALLPALGIYAGLRLRSTRDKFMSWRTLIMGLFVPAGLIMAFQYVFLYSSADSSNGIGLAPLLVMAHYSDSLLPKLGLSLAFPLSVYFLNFDKARRKLDLNLAWLTCLIGLGYAYFLAEFGPRLLHGNFVWSAQVTLFILFIVSIAFLLELAQQPISITMPSENQTLKMGICFTLAGLHVVSGLIWYAAHLALGYRWW